MEKTELNMMGIELQGIKKDLVQILTDLRRKRDYLFGAQPDPGSEPTGKICGVLPGVIGNLKTDIRDCKELVKEISSVGSDISWV